MQRPRLQPSVGPWQGLVHGRAQACQPLLRRLGEHHKRGAGPEVPVLALSATGALNVRQVGGQVRPLREHLLGVGARGLVWGRVIYGPSGQRQGVLPEEPLVTGALEEGHAQLSGFRLPLGAADLRRERVQDRDQPLKLVQVEGAAIAQRTERRLRPLAPRLLRVQEAPQALLQSTLEGRSLRRPSGVGQREHAAPGHEQRPRLEDERPRGRRQSEQPAAQQEGLGQRDGLILNAPNSCRRSSSSAATTAPGPTASLPSEVCADIGRGSTCTLG
mmetsp:Transcript_32586/g.65861  ORF Transcript_32586/g.65861 Transcript_32586/m.65861 type:complete len:274 (+) Transcript_32586:139-960(+)